MSSFMVPLTDIYFAGRQRQEYRDIPELARSLKQNGQIQSIVVRKPNVDENTDGLPWVLVVGGRRCAAALSIGITELSAEQLQDLPEWRQQLIELEENIQRSDLTFFEKAEAKAKIHALYSQQAVVEGREWSQHRTAFEIGDSRGNLSKDLRLHEAIKNDPTLKKATSRKAAVRVIEMREHIERTRAEVTRSETNGLTEIEKRVLCMDARDFVAQRPPKSVDLCLTDFPYGLEALAGGRGYNEGLSEYDDSAASAKALLRDVVPGMLRMMKPTGWLALMLSWEHHFMLRSLIENCCLTHGRYIEKQAGVPFVRPGDPYQCSGADDDDLDCFYVHCEDIPWVWYRPNSNNNPEWPTLHAQNMYELILICNMGEAKLVTSMAGRVQNVIVADVDYKSRIHSMQKPEALAHELITRLTLPGHCVVDLCHGSGVFLRVAAELYRDFAGCDTNPAIHDLAVGYVAEKWPGALPARTNDASRDSVPASTPPEHV